MVSYRNVSNNCMNTELCVTVSDRFLLLLFVVISLSWNLVTTYQSSYTSTPPIHLHGVVTMSVGWMIGSSSSGRG
jgi:hypothetical protein